MRCYKINRWKAYNDLLLLNCAAMRLLYRFRKAELYRVRRGKRALRALRCPAAAHAGLGRWFGGASGEAAPAVGDVV